jgi:Kelch motif
MCRKLQNFASGGLLFINGSLRNPPITFSNQSEAVVPPGCYPPIMINVSSIRLTVFAIGFGSLLSGCATHQPVSTKLAPLPETVTSFGAVTSDGWLYAFGGHKGERHDYSIEMVSGSFQRLKLNDGRAWQMLPSATPGQGQPLVAHDGIIYRIGGMAAHNHKDEKQNLYSLSLVQKFNPKTGHWEDMTPLPAVRSSHDAVVIGDKIYVAGGWQLAGGTNKPAWPSNALVFDLVHPQSGWQEFPQPFQRRALALAALGSRVICIGGMDSDSQPTLAVDIYDPASGQWIKGPDLPPGEFKGFSCSAIAQGGRVYVTTFQGDVLRLAKDERSWEVVGRLERPRMAHRLVTAGKTQLIALGGEDGEENKTPDLELLTPSALPQIASGTSTQTTATNAR